MTAFKVMRKGGDAMLKTIKRFIREEDGIGTVEMILILVEKPNAKHRYVLCGK